MNETEEIKQTDNYYELEANAAISAIQILLTKVKELEKENEFLGKECNEYEDHIKELERDIRDLNYKYNPYGTI